MRDLLVLDHDATRAALDPVRLMVAVGQALMAVADGTASAPPRIAARTPIGLLGAMPAHVPGLGLAAKLVTVFPDPTRPGRSSHRGVVVLFDEEDGRPVALLDAEPLTALRTAATATVAMHALARSDTRRIAVIGTGVQAAAQLTVLAALDTPAEVVVAGRDADRARALAATCPGATGAPSIEAAVRGADVVLCCTGAREPVVDHAWLREGAHVSSIGGSDGPELDAVIVRGGSLFVEWPGAVTCPPPAGAHELQGLAEDDTVLLGAVLSGRHPGRRSDDELTVFKSTGHAALDVAAANVAAAASRPSLMLKQDRPRLSPAGDA